MKKNNWIVYAEYILWKKWYEQKAWQLIPIGEFPNWTNEDIKLWNDLKNK